jgi:hypothetical protein
MGCGQTSEERAMEQGDGETAGPAVARAWAAGRREGLAIAALALGLVSFLNLLGAEKSLLALVLAAVTLSGGCAGRARRRAWIAIGLAALHIVTIAVVLIVFQDKLGQLLGLLRTLG